MSRSYRWHALASTAVTCAGFIAAGCGGGGGSEQLPTAPVSGTLAYEGKPVAKGTIHFHPPKGPTANGVVEDGKFTLSTYGEGDGAIVGKNRVAVQVYEEVPTKDGDTTSKSLIPKKYNEADTSGIELEIPPKGLPNLQIELLKEGGVRVKEE